MPLSLLSPTLTLSLTLIFSFHFTTSYSFPNCTTTTFSCGSIQNISYPFTGQTRPDHCGRPEFRLTCINNQTHLTIHAVNYIVLQINQTQKTMTLTRSDLYNTTCTNQFINSTFDQNFFSTRPENDDLTLTYGCNSSLINVRPSNLFTCNTSGDGNGGVNFTDSFYLVGPVPSDPVFNVFFCSVNVRVPILRRVGERLTRYRTSLGEALAEGFSLNYSDPDERFCLECVGIGGECVFYGNSGNPNPVCVCGESGDMPCPLPGNGNGNQTPRAVGLGIVGAALVGIGIGWFIFFCRLRRKRLAAQSAQTSSKDLPISSSSKDLPISASRKGLITTPSTAFAQSVPSYPSSKSDLGNGSFYFGVQVFTYAELEEATDNFNTSRELGDGGFGTVYYGELRDGRIVAVKLLYENNFKRLEQFMNEVEILTRLQHKNLVKLYGCTSKRSRELLLVYEYIPNGTVADHLHGKRANSGLLSWPVRLNIAIESAGALAFLHASDIIHRDVKTNNILLDNDFHVKVADFGLSRLFPSDVTHVSTAPQGTPGYVDPEYYQCYQLTEKSDIYSFGVVLIELISSLQAVDTNRHRHDINLSNMAVKKIQNHMLQELVDPTLGFETNTSVRRTITLVAELAFRCLQQERDVRPSIVEVLEVLKGIQNEKLNPQKAEVLDISVDDMPLLKGVLPSLSFDSDKKG